MKILLCQGSRSWVTLDPQAGVLRGTEHSEMMFGEVLISDVRISRDHGMGLLVWKTGSQRGFAFVLRCVVSGRVLTQMSSENSGL